MAVALEAWGWEIGAETAEKILLHSLVRQAVGLAQHQGFDIFSRLDSLGSN